MVSKFLSSHSATWPRNRWEERSRSSLPRPALGQGSCLTVPGKGTEDVEAHPETTPKYGMEWNHEEDDEGDDDQYDKENDEEKGEHVKVAKHKGRPRKRQRMTPPVHPPLLIARLIHARWAHLLLRIARLRQTNIGRSRKQYGIWKFLLGGVRQMIAFKLTLI